MVTRALENGVFTVTANRIGTEEADGVSLTFTGRSRIVSPDGVVLNDGPEDRVACDTAEIDPARADRKMVTPRNHLLDDRRPDRYFIGDR